MKQNQNLNMGIWRTIFNKVNTLTCADLQGDGGGVVVRTPPTPLEFAKLNIADITGNEKKLVIFHISALPQLYVKVGPPLEKFSGSAPALMTECIYDLWLYALKVMFFTWW